MIADWRPESVTNVFFLQNPHQQKPMRPSVNGLWYWYFSRKMCPHEHCTGNIAGIDGGDSREPSAA